MTRDPEPIAACRERSYTPPLLISTALKGSRFRFLGSPQYRVNRPKMCKELQAQNSHPWRKSHDIKKLRAQNPLAPASLLPHWLNNCCFPYYRPV